MSDEREKTRHELLSELESIQGLLDDDIPVLQEVIERLESQNSHSLNLQEKNNQLAFSDNKNQDANTVNSNSNTPEKDALKQPATPLQDNKAYPAHTTARGDNPFLPQHIRSRLRGNRAGDFATDVDDLKNTERQKLIDEVINDLLPQLKATLRTKLSSLTNRQLHALNSQDESPLS